MFVVIQRVSCLVYLALGEEEDTGSGVDLNILYAPPSMHPNGGRLKNGDRTHREHLIRAEPDGNRRVRGP